MDGKGNMFNLLVHSLMLRTMSGQMPLAYQLEHYPEMELVGKYESKEDLEVAYNVMKDLLKTYPDIKGVSGSAAGDVVGAGRAIEEMGLSDQIAVVGTSIPSYAGELLKTGAVDLAMSWDPAIVGYASNVVAYKLLKVNLLLMV